MRTLKVYNTYPFWENYFEEILPVKWKQIQERGKLGYRKPTVCKETSKT